MPASSPQRQKGGGDDLREKEEMKMIKFDKLKGRIRNFVISSGYYEVDNEGYVTEGGKRIDADELLLEMVYAGAISPEDAEAQDYREWI